MSRAKWAMERTIRQLNRAQIILSASTVDMSDLTIVLSDSGTFHFEVPITLHTFAEKRVSLL